MVKGLLLQTSHFGSLYASEVRPPTPEGRRFLRLDSDSSKWRRSSRASSHLSDRPQALIAWLPMWGGGGNIPKNAWPRTHTHTHHANETVLYWSCVLTQNLPAAHLATESVEYFSTTEVTARICDRGSALNVITSAKRC